MQVIKPKLSDEQKRQLKMTFNLMDADGGGTIDGKIVTLTQTGAHSTRLTCPTSFCRWAWIYMTLLQVESSVMPSRYSLKRLVQMCLLHLVPPKHGILI